MTNTFLALLLITALAGGCRTQGLLFFEDARLQIVRPQDRATIKAPVLIEWKVTDFEIVPTGRKTGPNQGHFGVFLDVSPPPSGEGLDYLFRDDPSCREELGCPSQADFQRIGIYEVTETRLILPAVPRRAAAPRGQEDFHEVTIVFLDGNSRRIGETSATVQFDLDRSLDV